MKEEDNRCTHTTKMEQVCKKCNLLFCPKCIVDHIQDEHGFELISHIDIEIEKVKGQTNNTIQQYRNAISILGNEITQLFRHSSQLESDRSLDDLFNSYERKLRDVISDAKNSKRSLIKKIKSAAKRLEKTRNEYEKKIVLLQQQDPAAMIEKPLKEVDIQTTIREVKVLLVQEPDTSGVKTKLDELVNGARNEAMNCIAKCLKGAFCEISSEYFRKKAQRKAELLKKYQIEIDNSKIALEKIKVDTEKLNKQYLEEKIKLMEHCSSAQEHIKICNEVKTIHNEICNNCNTMVSVKITSRCKSCDKQMCTLCLDKCLICNYNVCKNCKNCHTVYGTYGPRNNL